MSSICLEEGRAHQSRGTGLWSKVGAFMNSTGRDDLKDPREVKSPAVSPLESDLLSEDEDTSAKYTEAESEAACAKLWAIYVAEAEKYDKRLVESWKGDMDGLLIFSGLFSASLTAFLVESYTTLQPDPGVTNAALLTQISRQLAGSLNGTTIPFEEPLPFHPTTAALVCNILWFLSLVLSLTCALLATMVEQWAREFIHKSELRPSPARRVRIHSFLYLGLQKFGMYAIVDVIPLLLHASLIIFFVGLIFFLLPVNPLLMRLMSLVLAIFVVLYVTLTALPVIYLESPYQTPLSKGVWKFWQFSTALITTKLSKNMRPRIFPPLTMTQAMERRSQENPKSRDQHAIQWTVAALTDDSELLPFVEAIPDIVHGAKGFHRANDYLLHPLLYTQEPHIAIWPRVINLLRSSAIIPSADPLRIPHLTICLRAIWALSKSRGEQTLSVVSSPTAFYFDRETFRALEDPNLDSHYTISVRAAVRHKLLADLKARCQYVLVCLDGWEAASISSRRLTRQLIQSALVTVLKEGEFYAINLDIESQEIFRALQACYTLDVDPNRDARNAVAVATTGDEIAKAKEEAERPILNQRQALVSLRDTLQSKRGWANAHLAPPFLVSS
ncbi:hypothetical protein MVEN_00191200 [Mycena venus]|uniref:DUF6535 domain-containing protein n=1 Tax=Mycena venus TaxID=2733690 RepID=A0A8H6Z0D3_9AGAR|nr:hypothetical protein MVEN_00191200 [Mycena venus]